MVSLISFGSSRYVSHRVPLIDTDCLPHQLWFVTLREPLIATVDRH
jgi:hypothetical protein